MAYSTQPVLRSSVLQNTEKRQCFLFEFQVSAELIILCLFLFQTIDIGIVKLGGFLPYSHLFFLHFIIALPFDVVVYASGKFSLHKARNWIRKQDFLRVLLVPLAPINVCVFMLCNTHALVSSVFKVSLALFLSLIQSPTSTAPRNLQFEKVQDV